LQNNFIQKLNGDHFPGGTLHW